VSAKTIAITHGEANAKYHTAHLNISVHVNLPRKHKVLTSDKNIKKSPHPICLVILHCVYNRKPTITIVIPYNAHAVVISGPPSFISIKHYHTMIIHTDVDVRPIWYLN
jgi:hypothetical protein